MVLISLLGKVVDVATIGWLIRDEDGVEASFPECRQQALHPRKLLGMLCVRWREDDRDTLVGRIRLRHHVSEGD